VSRTLPGGGAADIGPYRLATRIAVGGMAEVFRALKPQAAGADRAVVIKRMLPALLEDPECRAMFEHEAGLGVRIRHDNVVEVLDHASDAGAPYLVLEYVFGVDLRRLARFLARSGRRLPVRIAMVIAIDLLAGLQAVHDAKDERGLPLHIVHRDVSPSNVFLSVHGDVKLGDLGIAQAWREAREAQGAQAIGSRAANAKGKLGYLAPEQVAGSACDPRSDVFAAATIAAELLLGRPLFAGGTELAVLLAIRDADIAPLKRIIGTLPDGLIEALLPALARAPEQRTQTADALRGALVPFVEDPIEARRTLGGMVVEALDAGETDDEGRMDRTSLARTIERSPSSIPPRAPTPVPPSAKPALAALQGKGGVGRLFDLDSPGASLGPSYRVQHGGRALGPWPYSRVVQALRTEEIDVSAEVAIDQGSMRPLVSVPELARHLPPSSATPSIAAETLSPTTRVPSTVTSELFDLSRGGVAGVLVQMLRSRESGLLLCEHADVRKEIHLERGVPTFVTSNRVEELLGERLVRDGVVDRTELDLALAVMPRFEGRLGDTLVALGLVEPIMLFRCIAVQVREKLIDIFAWTEGRAALYRHAAAPARSFPLDLDPWGLLEAGIQRRLEGMPPPAGSGRPRFVADPTWEPEGLVLPEPLAALASSLTRPRTLAEIDPRLIAPERARAVLALLVTVGAIRQEA
jgi:serine/threonine protein kinase